MWQAALRQGSGVYRCRCALKTTRSSQLSSIYITCVHIIAGNAYRYRNIHSLPQRAARESGHLRLEVSYEGNKAAHQGKAPALRVLAAALASGRPPRHRRFTGKQTDTRDRPPAPTPGPENTRPPAGPTQPQNLRRRLRGIEQTAQNIACSSSLRTAPTGQSRVGLTCNSG